MSNPTDSFYTYLWLREDGTPYYVGKGSGYRAFVRHRVGRPPSKERILLQHWPGEDTAFAFERYLIDFWGRKDIGTGCLNNLSDGGDQNNPMQGKKHTEETKAKIAASLFGKRKGATLTEEQRANISKGQTGRKLSDSWKRSMSLARLGKPHPMKKRRPR